VTKNVPDYSILVGAPGKIVGSTLDTDARFFAEYNFSDTYYDKDALALIKEKLT
jgi:serine acetyltransferase